MTLTAEQRAELRDLTDALCEEALTAEQAARLEALVGGHDEACRYYLSYLNLHGALLLDNAGDDLRDALRLVCESAEAAGGTPAPARSPILGFLGDLGQRGMDWFSNPTRLSMLIAAMVLGSLVIVVAFWAAPIYRDWIRPSRPPVEPEQVARLTQTIDCRWGDRGAAPAEGSRLALGQQLDLVEGLAEITFDSGAWIILHGPATLEAESRNGGFLRVGKLTAMVPEEATGFTVRTPTATVVDLGCRFGVRVDPEGVCEVHVFAGTVQVQSQSGGSSRWVAGGCAVRVAPAGSSPLAWTPVAERSFQQNVRPGDKPLVRLLPASYDMPNGEKKEGTYRDDTYTGQGDVSVDGAQLTGGLGHLTDGITAQPRLLWDMPPWVAWSIDPTITFHFDRPVSIDTIVIHTVKMTEFEIKLPRRVEISMDSGEPRLLDIDEGNEGLHRLTFSGLNLVGRTLRLKIARREKWLFVNEVSFFGLPEAAAKTESPRTTATGGL